MKKLIAYSSVAHMGFVTIGIFALDRAGRAGRDLPDAEPRHRLGARCSSASASSTTACTRARSTAMAGSSHRMPVYAVVFMLFMLASVGLPGTSGFVGEFLVLARRLPGQHLGRRPRRDRHHPRRRLHALALSPRHLRQARPRDDLQEHPRSEPARDGGLRAAGRCWCSGWASIPRSFLDVIGAVGRQAGRATITRRDRAHRDRRCHRWRSAFAPPVMHAELALAHDLVPALPEICPGRAPAMALLHARRLPRRRADAR